MNYMNPMAQFKPTRLASFIFCMLAILSHPSMARDYFDPSLIELDDPSMKGADLSSFETGSQMPGTYRVDVVLDDQYVDSLDIPFVAVKSADGEDTLQPCLKIEWLKNWGVKTDLFPGLNSKGDCADLSAISQASAKLQFNEQRLVISIPQAALVPLARGYVPPEKWDEGITAAMLNYSVSGDNSWGRNGNTNNGQSQYANLRPGVNIGPWRFRNYTTWSRDSNGQDSWDTVYTYVQRAIIPFKSQLTMGDSSSPSDIFDSLPFRGAQLASDDDMLPDSQKGYAPVVRGIARTNAQVMIRQNGYIIYQSYVAPGAFEINDMYPTGGAGDLDVTVKEADGSEQHFTVPYASLPVLQREGRFKYSATGGQYRSYSSSVEKTPFGQITGIYGLSRGVTLYGGAQQSSKYQSVASGIGVNLGDAGAISTDVTQAWSKPNQQNDSSGQSWRIRYSKNFVETGTNFAIAGYRYSTNGYYGMQEILDSYGDSSALQNRRRNRMELSMSQTLGQSLGSLMVSAVREDYWNSGESMETYTLGYNNSWSGISYGVTYTYSKNGTAGDYGNTISYDKDQQLAVNISIQFDKFLPNSWVSYSMNASKNNGTSHSIGINGTALENNALSWGVQQGYGTNNVGNTGNMNADYKGTYGEVTSGYSYDKYNERLTYGLQGGVIAHAHGITLSQPLGETNVLIEAPGADGVSIQNQTGVKTDYRGYTSINNVSPYRENSITLQTDTIPEDIDLPLTTHTVVPTRGAIVPAKYDANVGIKILMTILKTNGKPVPFGTIVTNKDKKEQGFIVSDRGQVYLTGMESSGVLNATWGADSQQSCSIHFNTEKSAKTAGIVLNTSSCNSH